MGARTSQAMLDALALIKSGHTAAEASRQTGISKGAISQNAEYRKFIEAKAKKAKNAKR